MRARDVGRGRHGRGMPPPRPTAPACPVCQSPHLVGLPCWRGRYVTRLRLALLPLLGGVCWLCGCDGADTLDHVVARAMGGTDDPANLRPAHRACNSRRGTRAAVPATAALHTDATSWFL